MYKGASRRTGGSSRTGFATPQWWTGEDRHSVEHNPLLIRLKRKATDLGSARNFVSGLSDYWIAEIISRLYREGVVVNRSMAPVWKQVKPKLKQSGRELELSAEERRAAHEALVQFIDEFVGEVPRRRRS